MWRRWPMATIIEVTPFFVVIVLFFHSTFITTIPNFTQLSMCELFVFDTYPAYTHGSLCMCGGVIFEIDFIMLAPWLPHHYFINIPLLLWLWLSLLGIKRQSHTQWHTHTHVHDKQLAEIISLIYLIVRITDTVCTVCFGYIYLCMCACESMDTYLYSYATLSSGWMPFFICAPTILINTYVSMKQCDRSVRLWNIYLNMDMNG